MHQPTVQTIKLGIFFFLIFTAYTSFQTIVTYIYQNLDLTAAGPLNFIFNYIAFLVSSLFAPKCKLSFKAQMIIGSFGHGFNVATGLYVPYIQDKYLAYVLISFGGIVAGSVAGFMWISQGGYLRQVVKNQPDKGKYSAIFQLLYSFSSLIAGFITTFFLGFFSDEIYFLVLTIIVGLSAVFGLIFFQNIKQTQTTSQQQPSQQLSQKKQQKQQNDVCNDLKQTFLFYPQMLPILCMLFLDGIVLGMYSNQVIRLMPAQSDTKIRDRLAGIITIFIGLGSMLGGLSGGFISDKIGLLNAGRFTLGCYLLCAILNFTAIYYNQYWFVCLVGFAWGAEYYFFEAWIYVAILKLYQGRLQAFAVNKQVHCISFAIFQIIVLVTDNQLDLRILVPIVALFVIPSFWSIHQANYKRQQQINNKSLNPHSIILTQQKSAANYVTVKQASF